MKKEIEKAKKDKAKVRYVLLTVINMDCFIEIIYCARLPRCACVYAAGGESKEEIPG